MEKEHKWTPPPTPSLAVDMLVRMLRPIGNNQTEQIILMIERKFPPLGSAFPGGFVDIGESCRTAASREIHEETGLVIKPSAWNLFGEFSEPDRDPRAHIVSICFECFYHGSEADAIAGDDAKGLQWVRVSDLTERNMASKGHTEIAAAAYMNFLFPQEG